ncbi:MAG: type 4a pilus biogenesis protein PilO [Phycisphaerae bacterium]|nr:type 4a pilus biogenesis protein PilO [Phycisphaerae bacterium]
MSIAVVALAAAFVLFQFMPLNEKTKILKAANANLIAEDAAAAAKEKALPQLREEIARMEGQMGNFDAKIPVDRSYGSFLQELTSIMEQQGLEELMVQPGVEVKNADQFRIPVKINCTGELMQIFNFFKALEKLERVIQIEEVSLTNNDKSDGSVKMQAMINIFYRTE